MHRLTLHVCFALQKHALVMVRQHVTLHVRFALQKQALVIAVQRLTLHVCLTLQKHALVMGNTWGVLIPLTILMATLRHKKQGWWFHLHRASAVLSLILVIVGVILGRRLRITHPPVTVAGKCHKIMGYAALSLICFQVRQHSVHGAALCHAVALNGAFGNLMPQYHSLLQIAQGHRLQRLVIYLFSGEAT